MFHSQHAVFKNVPFTACCFKKESERNQNRNLHVLYIGQKLKVESYKGYYLKKSILFQCPFLNIV